MILAIYIFATKYGDRVTTYLQLLGEVLENPRVPINFEPRGKKPKKKKYNFDIGHAAVSPPHS